MVQISALDALAKSIGSNRIVRGKAITSVVGDPTLNPEDERKFRKRLVQKGARGAADPGGGADGPRVTEHTELSGSREEWK